MANSQVEITVRGLNFDRDCSIIADNKKLQTTFVNNTKLYAAIGKEMTNLSLSSANKKIKIFVEKKDDSTDESIVSNAVSIEVRHVPMCGKPVLIRSGSDIKSISDVNLLTNSSDYFVLSWKEKKVSEDKYQGKFIISNDNFSTWSNPKDFSGYFFIHNNIFYNIKNGKIYLSKDKGDTWELIGEKLEYTPSQPILNEYLRWVGEENLYYIYTIQTSNSILKVYTYYSTDFGKSWAYISENLFDYSMDYDGEGVSPCGALMNDNKGIRLEFLTRSGRDMIGTSLISDNGGYTYRKTKWAFSDHGLAYLSSDNTIYAILRTFYTTFMISEEFYCKPDLGTGEGYSHDIWKLIPRYGADSQTRLDINFSGHFFINRGDMMICSYDKGKNWSTPTEFQKDFPKGSKLFPFFTKQGICYTIIITKDNDLYISNSIQK